MRLRKFCAEVYRRSLLPLTKIVPFTSLVVQALLAFAGFFAPDLTGLSTFATQFQYTDGFYLAGAIGALYALLQDNWIAARTYLAIEFVVVASFVAITILNAWIPPASSPLPGHTCSCPSSFCPLW